MKFEIRATTVEQKEIGTYLLFELINKARTSIKRTTITNRLKEIEEEYVLDKVKPTECEMEILGYKIKGLLKNEKKLYGRNI